MDVLDVLLLLGGDHLRGLAGLEILQTSPYLSLSAPLTKPLKHGYFWPPIRGPSESVVVS